MPPRRQKTSVTVPRQFLICMSLATLAIASSVSWHGPLGRSVGQRRSPRAFHDGGVVGFGRETLAPHLQQAAHNVRNCANATMSCTNDLLNSLQRSVAQRIPEYEQPDVQALLVEELRRLHEVVLARYGLRPSDYAAWKALTSAKL